MASAVGLPTVALTQELHADHAKRYHSDSGSPKDRRPDRAGKDGSQADRVLRPKEMPKQQQQPDRDECEHQTCASNGLSNHDGA